MTKLAKYLKPYTLWIIVCFSFLFVRAFSDLNLPNYMSDIVNVGLQQSGIESPVPEAISENMFTQIGMVAGDTAELFNNSYTKINAGNSDYTQKYPESKNTNIYVLNSNVSAKDKTTIGETLGKTAEIGILMQQGISPQEATATAEKTDPSMLTQMGTQAVKMIYKELGVDIDSIQKNYIFITGLKMLGITVLGAIAAIIVALLAARIAAGACTTLRKDIFNKVENFSSNEFDRFSTSSLITRTTNDVTQIQMLVTMGLKMMALAPIMGIGGIVMAVRKGPSMSWIIALTVLVMILIMGVIFVIAMPKFKIMQKLIDKLNLVFRENLTGIMAVRAFGNQDFSKERFDKANKDVTANSLFIGKIIIFMFPAMILLMNLTMLLIVWVGADKISQSAMQVGDMMAFIQYAMQIIMSFLMISMIFVMVPRAAVSGDRIYEVLKTNQEITDPQNPEEFKSSEKGYVEFKNVSFKYHGADEDVLSNINFVARPGQTTAIIGSTGSGKSTLINLIPRFYDVTEGEVLVNGVNVKNVTQHALRKQIGYVPQKGILHRGTIATNIRYGNENATDEEIKKVAETAQATEFIDTLEDSFETEISQGGTNVSGGQKQRLSIARALAINAPIYIFDDSFSALDFKTDAKLRKSLKDYTKNATLIIVAQRVSTIMHAEQIIVIDEGKIVGKGTHEQLLKNCQTYIQIASSQLSKEELENE